MQSNKVLCAVVKILPTRVCTVIMSLTASLCSACVEAQEPIPAWKMCICIKHKPPTGGHCRQELAERSLGGFAICCLSCPFEHIHLLLASPCAAAGISHGIMGLYSATILFSLPSCLCLWSGTVTFSPAPPFEA